VGGAIVNNAGAFGSSVAECLERATLLLDDGSCVELTQQDLGYAYRSSVLKRGELGRAVVLDGRFRLARGPVEVTLGQVRTFQSQRTETQPRQLSAGSVFANPADDYAGRLIEAACLKGLRRGPAEISRQHANFIVNRGGASSRQVYELMRTAQESVWQKFGVWLRPEIQLIGRWPPRDVAALEGPEEAR